MRAEFLSHVGLLEKIMKMQYTVMSKAVFVVADGIGGKGRGNSICYCGTWWRKNHGRILMQACCDVARRPFMRRVTSFIIEGKRTRHGRDGNNHDCRGD